MKNLLKKFDCYNEKNDFIYDSLLTEINDYDCENNNHISEGYRYVKYIFSEYLDDKVFGKMSNEEKDRLFLEYINSNDILKASLILNLDKNIVNYSSISDRNIKIQKLFFGICDFIYSKGYNKLKKFLFDNIFYYSTILHFSKINVFTLYELKCVNIRLISLLVSHSDSIVEIYYDENRDKTTMFYIDNYLYGEAQGATIFESLNNLAFNVYNFFIKKHLENVQYNLIENEIDSIPRNEKKKQLNEYYGTELKFIADFNNSEKIEVKKGDEVLCKVCGKNQDDALTQAINTLYYENFRNDIFEKIKLTDEFIHLSQNWNLVVEKNKENLKTIKKIIQLKLHQNTSFNIENNELFIIDQKNNKLYSEPVKNEDDFNEIYEIILNYFWTDILSFDTSIEKIIKRDNDYQEIFHKIQQLMRSIKTTYKIKNIFLKFNDNEVELYIDNKFYDKKESISPLESAWQILQSFNDGYCQLNDETFYKNEIDQEHNQKWTEIKEYYSGHEISLSAPNGNENYYVFFIDEKENDCLLGNSPSDAITKLIDKIYAKVKIEKQKNANNNCKNPKVTKPVNNEPKKPLGYEQGRYLPITEELLAEIFKMESDRENIKNRLLAKFNGPLNSLSYKINTENISLYFKRDYLIGEVRGYNSIKSFERLLRKTAEKDIIVARLVQEKVTNYTTFKAKNKAIIEHYCDKIIKLIIDENDHRQIQFVVDGNVKYEFKLENTTNSIINVIDLIYELDIKQ